MNTRIKFGNQVYLTNQVFKGTVSNTCRSLIKMWLLVVRGRKVRFINQSRRFSYERKHFCEIQS